MGIEYHINEVMSSVTYRAGNILIDPGDKWEGFNYVKCVLLTHAHFDHIYGLNDLLELDNRILVFTNEIGREMLLNSRMNMSFYHETPFVFRFPSNIKIVYHLEEMSMGDIVIKAVFTPGHNPSCITWIVGDFVFCGDSYIPGLKTVTNLPGGDKKQALESTCLIKQLTIGRQMYPGHKM